MRPLWLVLCAGLATALTCTNTTYANYYFQWCLADTECQDNLHLYDDDLWTFTETLDYELLAPMHLTGASMCDPLVEPFWQALLRTVNLCYPNHYRDSVGACVLRPGRTEDPDVDFRTGLSGVSSPFLLAALIGVFLWLAVKDLRAWEEIRQKLKTLYREPAPTDGSAEQNYNVANPPAAGQKPESLKFMMFG